MTGKVGAAYGVKGWLKIHSYTEDPIQILCYSPWYLMEENIWLPLELEDGKKHGKGVVAKFTGIETPEAARKLTGKLLAVKREQLAALPENEYYWADLEGLSVIDQRGQLLGRVSYLIATGSNDVLVLKDNQGKEQAIPYLPGSVVKKVDLEKGQIF